MLTGIGHLWPYSPPCPPQAFTGDVIALRSLTMLFKSGLQAFPRFIGLLCIQMGALGRY
jgi:hypothetical protein